MVVANLTKPKYFLQRVTKILGDTREEAQMQQ
jgi:hypothetical protein